MSCQTTHHLGTVTETLINKMYIPKLFSYVNPFSCQIYKINPGTNIKQNVHTQHKHQTPHFEALVPSTLHLLNKNHINVYNIRLGNVLLTIPSDLSRLVLADTRLNFAIVATVKRLGLISRWGAQHLKCSYNMYDKDATLTSSEYKDLFWEARRHYQKSTTHYYWQKQKPKPKTEGKPDNLLPCPIQLIWAPRHLCVFFVVVRQFKLKKYDFTNLHFHVMYLTTETGGSSLFSIKLFRFFVLFLFLKENK